MYKVSSAGDLVSCLVVADNLLQDWRHCAVLWRQGDVRFGETGESDE